MSEACKTFKAGAINEKFSDIKDEAFMNWVKEIQLDEAKTVARAFACDVATMALNEMVQVEVGRTIIDRFCFWIANSAWLPSDLRDVLYQDAVELFDAHYKDFADWYKEDAKEYERAKAEEKAESIRSEEEFEKYYEDLKARDFNGGNQWHAIIKALNTVDFKKGDILEINIVSKLRETVDDR